MQFIAVFSNSVLRVALSAWALAQILKVPLHYLKNHTWDWSLLLRAGGMPSSHSALVAATAHGIGLYQGFDTPLFAVAFVLAVIVIYDATGVRRQAGKHAERINAIIEDLRHGRPHWHETQEQLKEVLGHTPVEAIAGAILGIVVAQLGWFSGL
ncbi:MAG: divergent PAP2 family protein [Anaerolineales bacterium]|jgi:acid phosphatase family membrane protein YuiD